MKQQTFFGPFAAVMLALAAPGWAREPLGSVADLAKLERQVSDVAAKVMPSTVALVADQVGASGSGVVVSEDGLILTAAHVVQGADTLQVVFPDGKEVTGKVLGANFSKDIAMVKITGGGKWPAVARGESKPLQAGDWVFALGHSAGFDPARTPPVRFGRVVSKGPGNFLTTDCTLIGGDSGGPLFDLTGKIVGINSSIGMSRMNNNHAGVDGFRDDWARLMTGEQWGKLTMNPFANPEKPVLGVGMGQDGRGGGVSVASVTPRSPAAAAGVKPGDIVVAFDGERLKDGRELLIQLAKRQPGDRIKLGLQRDGETREVSVTLARYDELYANGARGMNFDLPELDPGLGDIPLLRPEERKETERQAQELYDVTRPLVRAASDSTVWVWTGRRAPVCFGVVVGDGRQVLTKWSEVVRGRGVAQVVDATGATRSAKIAGVYEDEDLALLSFEGEPLKPVQWAAGESPRIGRFLVAASPDGQPAGFGVVSVKERNLRESDQAFLGIAAQPVSKGTGARVEQVEPSSGAAAAGLKAGDVILKIDDRPLSGLRELRSALTGKVPGDEVALQIARNGREETLRVKLANRPELPQFTNPRLRQMEQMGGAISRVRGAFPSAIQTDMQVEPEQCGAPVVDLDGKVIGLLAARADRTRSFIIPAADIVAMLKRPAGDPLVAKVRTPKEAEAFPQAMAGGEGEPPAFAPRGRALPMDGEGADRLRRHFHDMQRLMERMREEMDALEQR
ncbi:MAG TPA: trypsin-like peptidase domain-containing protein [Luteolibacter sp.]